MRCLFVSFILIEPLRVIGESDQGHPSSQPKTGADFSLFYLVALATILRKLVALATCFFEAKLCPLRQDDRRAIDGVVFDRLQRFIHFV